MSGCDSLKSSFYNSFDASLIIGFLGRIAKVSEAERRGLPGFLGEGIHFQSFELRSGDMTLAVNVAKQSFVKRGEAAIRRWQEAVQIARGIEGAVLIPPMDVMVAHGLTAIVMPKGDKVTRAGAKAVDLMLHDTARALGSAGLVLDDYPQVREAMGVPFIVDWSDLTFTR